MHGDPFSVLDILDVTVKTPFITTSYMPHPQLLYSSPCLLSYPSCIYNSHSSYSTCGCSLQGWGNRALTNASRNGHTETVHALLTSPGIDVNHIDVSIYSFTTSHVVVGAEGGGGITIPYPPPLVTMTYYPPSLLGDNKSTPFFRIVYFNLPCITTLFPS